MHYNSAINNMINSAIKDVIINTINLVNNKQTIILNI